MIAVAGKILIAILILIVIGIIMTCTMSSTEKSLQRITGHFPLRVEIFIAIIRLLAFVCLICFIISIFE